MNTEPITDSVVERKKQAHNAAAVNAAKRRLDIEKAIDLSKHDKSTPWSKSVSDKEKPAAKK